MELRHLYVDDRSPVPVYAQLSERILGAIARGDLSPGEQLPSVRDVAARLGINPNTVNRAYAELERVGTVETRRGRGTFVARRTDARRPAFHGWPRSPSRSSRAHKPWAMPATTSSVPLRAS